jgi:TetR/AcrR family transcriptional repressor of nem operon
MRYASHHKQATRERIIEMASRLFREQGFEEAGVQGLMAGAGLTHGAFYNHFSSKEELIAQATSAAFKQRLARVKESMDGEQGVAGHINNYFSASHRDHPGRGCPAAPLASEVARHSVEVRQTFAEGVGRLIALFATQWPDLPKEAAGARALALYGLMVGSMQLARAMPDEALSNRMLEAGKRAALAMLPSAQGGDPP